MSIMFLGPILAAIASAAGIFQLFRMLRDSDGTAVRKLAAAEDRARRL